MSAEEEEHGDVAGVNSPSKSNHRAPAVGSETAALDGLDDLDELDDSEFEIPPVDKPPTLESILNAPDDDGPAEGYVTSDVFLQVLHKLVGISYV